MSFDRQRITDHIAITFKVGALRDQAVITCPITGILGTISMPSVPITFSYQHPLSSISNVRTLIKECKDRDIELRHVLERQTLAGITLCLLTYCRLLKNEPIITTTEKNLFLQGCGNLLLEKGIKFLNYLSHTPFIEDHWKGTNKFPLFSFSWAENASVNSFSESFLQYCKTLREKTDPSAIEQDRIGNISMDFIKEIKPREADWYGDIQKRLRLIRDLRTEKKSFKELKEQAKSIFEDLEPFLSKELQAMCKLVIRNLHLGIAEEHASFLTSKLFLLQNDDADKLAKIIKSSVSVHLADSLASFSQEVSPKPVTSIAEILALKKAKDKGIIIEVTPRTAEEEQALKDKDVDSDLESEELQETIEEDFVISEVEDSEQEDDLYDKIIRPSNPRSFKEEI